jgi:cytochrome c oxidase subunit II
MKRSLMATITLVLLGTTVAAVRLTAQDSQPQVVAISAKRFEFKPNAITLKRGQPVILRVSAEDRDHGFYQKDLGVDLDLTPDHPSEVTLTPDKAGRFTVICDHFCGSGHGNMKMTINVE